MQKPLPALRSSLVLPFLAVFGCWFVYGVARYYSMDLTAFGLYPRQFAGIRGIVLAPFIHSGSRHLLHNSLPLFVLLWALCYFYRQIAAKVLVRGLFFTGMLTWFFARPAYHIGASGLVYLLVSFVFFSGMIRQYYRLVALSLAVVFIYGSMVWYLFPIKASISWEGHLSGFVTGLFLAYWHRKQGPQPEVFQFSNTDDFDELFDAEGNFVPAETVEETPERE